MPLLEDGCVPGDGYSFKGEELGLKLVQIKSQAIGKGLAVARPRQVLRKGL